MTDSEANKQAGEQTPAQTPEQTAPAATPDAAPEGAANEANAEGKVNAPKEAKPKLKCDECGQVMPNGYVLKKHMAAKHSAARKDMPPEDVAKPIEMPETVKLRFKVPVEFNINGKAYAGKEIHVPYESLSAATETVRAAYGDVLL